MRRARATLAAVLTLGLGIAPAASAQVGGGGVGSATAPPTTAAGATLVRSLATGMRQAGSYSGADVVDLSTGQTLYTHDAGTGRLPASVEKLYTTVSALQRFGPTATLTTSILGLGQRQGTRFVGTLYLRGGGDPTFGSATFDHADYGGGATIQRLVANFERATGIRALTGNIVADETMFDTDRGTPATDNQPSIEVEGELSALAFDRGWATSDGTVYNAHPAIEAGEQLVAALRAAGVTVPRRTRVTAGSTPPGTTTLATVHSPSIASLISLTNTPSDNFFAETLLKDLGARFGGSGSTAAGAAVVRAQIAQSFGIRPRLNDGSGLSRYDLTSPLQVVTLLRGMATNPQFTASLAVAGETGTLGDEMQGTYAEGRCRGKTGTLHDVSNVVGYCQARDGHTLAFAFMMNAIVPDYAHPIQDRMQVAVASYRG
ncbi:MAG: D-alanyl-D-alanine carboxypeptidase/D-alanyl-D-alanine-endopeptidase [Solirubrobacteraceae bacterium]